MASEQFAAFSPDTLAEAPQPRLPARTSIRAAADATSSGVDDRRSKPVGSRSPRSRSARLERAVGQRGLGRARDAGSAGQTVEVDPRRAAAVLLAATGTVTGSASR